MEKTNSAEDIQKLVSILNAAYPTRVFSMRTHRDWIGHVYFVESTDGPYVLKLYRPFHTKQALHSTHIIQYLMAQDYPVPPIVCTSSGESNIEVDMPDGRSVAILYQYIQGEEPDPETDLKQIAEQAGILHRLMATYPGMLDRHGKEYYIDRYITLLSRIGFPDNKLSDLTHYGDELWDRFDQSARGFCHGDLHCGNMLMDNGGNCWLFDFDAACRSHPAADISTMIDSTDYFQFHPEDFEKTTRRLGLFLPSYQKTCPVAIEDHDIQSIYDFIAIRHFDIQATISECQGYSLHHLENQHSWLMRWRDLCEQRLKL